MEITNEIKAKVFAQYLGQQTKRTMYYSSDLTFHSETIISLDFKRLDHLDIPPSINIGKVVDILILKPLSSITYEDAIEVADIVGIDKIYKGHDRIHRAKMFLKQISACKWDLYQFLQSKGYDLPHYLLNGKTLQECGLAIHE